MPISMYQVSVPRFIDILTNLSAILGKAQAHVNAKNLDPTALTRYRLFPDMYPLLRQVQVACDRAKNAVAVLAGIPAPQFEDTEKTFAELQARIAKTIEFIRSVKPERIEGTDDKDLKLNRHGREMTMKGMHYLLDNALPHFYFHVVTAYAILRHNGVELGKRDFLGDH